MTRGTTWSSATTPSCSAGVAEATFPTATDYTGAINTTSGRFQTLCGTLLYSRTDRTNACGFGNPVTQDNSGLLLVNGVWQTYRDPDSPRHSTRIPWWAEYLVDFDDEDLSHQFHSFDVQLSVDALTATEPHRPRAPAASATTTSPAARDTTCSSARWATT